MNCEHKKVRCLNHYDTFRKYECEKCGGIFICECERQLALAVLPHQVRFAYEYGTRKKHQVNGFAPSMCAECRGEKEEAHPRASIYGQKGKIARYYWREIFKTYSEYALEWLHQNSVQVKDILEFQAKFPDEAKEFKRKARKHWQTVNKQNPKYNLKEKTESQFFSEMKIPITNIKAGYQQIEKNGQMIGKWLNQAGELVAVEKIATEWYISKGYKVLACERLFISVWVATFLAHALQDIGDSRVRQTFRNSTRGWTSKNRKTRLIAINLPEDFGSSEYYERRRVALQDCIQRMRDTDDLQALFIELLGESESLRDYLWVNDDNAVESARTTLDVLPKDLVISCVEWAVQDFWNRQPGWPDLFVYRNNGFMFVEVKSPLDELSKEQMNWFMWASEDIHIPSEICRVDRLKG